MHACASALSCQNSTLDQQRSGLGHCLASAHLGVDLLDVLALGERTLVGAQLVKASGKLKDRARAREGGGGRQGNNIKIL